MSKYNDMEFAITNIQNYENLVALSDSISTDISIKRSEATSLNFWIENMLGDIQTYGSYDKIIHSLELYKKDNNIQHIDEIIFECKEHQKLLKAIQNGN
jgi:hypothetical protein